MFPCDFSEVFTTVLKNTSVRQLVYFAMFDQLHIKDVASIWVFIDYTGFFYKNTYKILASLKIFYQNRGFNPYIIFIWTSSHRRCSVRKA